MSNDARRAEVFRVRAAEGMMRAALSGVSGSRGADWLFLLLMLQLLAAAPRRPSDPALVAVATIPL